MNIIVEDNVFYLHTNHTTYIMMIDEQGHVEHVYYGAKIEQIETIDDVRYRYDFEQGSATSYSKEDKGVMLNQKPLEISWFGKGDYREPTLHVELPSGSRTIDLVYDSHRMVENLHFNGLPQVEKERTLVIVLVDKINNLEVELYYTVIPEKDVIVRNLKIINHNAEPIVLDKILSFNLDLQNDEYMLRKLDGAWIRERHIHDTLLTHGTVRFDSKKGVSSSDHNPFFILKQKHTNEDYGKAYGFALLYSGNFEANVEMNPHDVLRVNMGINGFDFRYPLQPEESFVTPEVILTFSSSGIGLLSNQFHNLINDQIINKNFRYKERPILINNWEATYFDFNQKKILAIAKKAKSLGIECLCLDDGWFAGRNDDFSSLGDWYYNPKKLPRGLTHLAKKINSLGLDFGLWVEPEMVNEDSELYKKHPDWAIKVPNIEPSLGRNQLILDFTNPDVRDYIKQTLTAILNSANISYVKWDMNRNFSDVYSSYLTAENQGKLNHLYVLGLYEVLEYLTTTFPDILFESCSSGGNRFDLGMLYYMPQTWTSDNTDMYERLLIQEGTSMLYPLSTISNHVSGNRSHQVLRHTPLESRFNVASFGVLGYELDITECTPLELHMIKNQIAFYKKHRFLLQYGTLKRIQSVYNTNYTIWVVESPLADQAIVLYAQKLALPNPAQAEFPIPGLQAGLYDIKNRKQYIDVRTFGSLINRISPIHLKPQSALHSIVANRFKMEVEETHIQLTSTQLQYMNVRLPHKFTGTDHGDRDMILEDFGSRLYVVTKSEKNNSVIV